MLPRKWYVLHNASLTEYDQKSIVPMTNILLMLEGGGPLQLVL